METTTPVHEILDQILQAYNENQIGEKDLKKISEYCDLMYKFSEKSNKSFLNGIQKHFYTPIDPKIAAESVDDFNRRFSDYKSHFVLIPPFVEKLLEEANGDKIRTCLTARYNDKTRAYVLDIAFKFENGNAYEVNNPNPISNLQDRIDLFDRYIKNNLDTEDNPDGYKCPSTIVIDNKDLSEFIPHLTSSNWRVVLETGISKSSSNEDKNRVTLVMGFWDTNNGSAIDDYYDYFKACPPRKYCQ